MTNVRRLFVSGITAVSLFTGVSTVGQGAYIEHARHAQKSLILPSKTLPEGIPIKQEKQTEIRAQEAVKPIVKPKPKPYTELTVTATAYVSYCDTGCIGITATGLDVSNSITTKEGYGIIAVDPAVIPLGSVVEIEGRRYKAADTGGAIKGHRIDILMGVRNTSKAFEFGKQILTVKVYK